MYDIYFGQPSDFIMNNYRIIKESRHHESDIFFVEQRFLFIFWRRIKERGGHVYFTSYRPAVTFIYNMNNKKTRRVVSEHRLGI